MLGTEKLAVCSLVLHVFFLLHLGKLCQQFSAAGSNTFINLGCLFQIPSSFIRTEDFDVCSPSSIQSFDILCEREITKLTQLYTLLTIYHTVCMSHIIQHVRTIPFVYATKALTYHHYARGIFNFFHFKTISQFPLTKHLYSCSLKATS